MKSITQALIVSVLCLFSFTSMAQDSRYQEGISLNDLIRVVGERTGNTFVSNSNIKGSVNLIINFDNSSDKQLFDILNQALLLNNYGLVNKGEFYIILPTHDLKNKSSTLAINNDMTGDFVDTQNSEVITDIIHLKYLTASNAMIILKPLVARYGYISTIETHSVNSLIIVDHVANIERFRQLINEFDIPR